MAGGGGLAFYLQPQRSLSMAQQEEPGEAIPQNRAALSLSRIIIADEEPGSTNLGPRRTQTSKLSISEVLIRIVAMVCAPVPPRKSAGASPAPPQSLVVSAGAWDVLQGELGCLPRG
jgi:hypothetical protein